MRRATALTLVLLAFAASICLVVTRPTPAVADLRRVHDPDDIKTLSGRDIKEVVASHGTGQELAYSFSFYQNIISEMFQHGTYAAVVFDTDGDPTTAERYAVIYGIKYHWYAKIVTAGGREVGAATVTRPDNKTVRITFPRYWLTKRTTNYQWFAYAKTALKKCCMDYAPDHGWILHDVEPPVITSITTSASNNLVPLSNAIDFTFAVTDEGLGLDSWAFKFRHGEINLHTPWTTAASGTGADLSPTITLPQGDEYDTCLVVKDRAGNKASMPSIGLVIPLDDGASQLTYSSGWSTNSDATAYLSTLHATSSIGSWVEMTAGDDAVLVLPTGFDGVVGVSVNGSWKYDLDEASITDPRSLAGGPIGAITQRSTVRLTLKSGTFALDGVELNQINTVRYCGGA